ncbi:proline-rich protein 5-like isoform X1 [Hypanus sabinus]|uniref:proline-rich protein 5-like isoform X1 n=1 Tax=Hypanus sabinus TaxID=79690 RepID=UPI0028C4E80D|nr:proline-rich protein 5-like isoform X1 [Hypanus sabinus]XP_059831451.1 proline-rich protein 5-like isoform X1 [Hypanus sabinus]XP_059831452.1 proline-rich protein 5-like isoform X1 [Hypanus sabinus]XP_059831453.1 proline-rich protein 5-like isoform X1 [Hypanus sabinus]XP_059831455.1 proline-rich protein 5-like isoform X1 [Hypanus sabinus]
MGSFRKPRPRFLSSPVLSDLPQFHAARQAALLGSNKAWNSVHKAVIKVFQGGSLQDNELYSLNENIRQLLKSELGPFITDYFQNHLLSKGLILMEEKMRVCEGENLLEALTRIWDHFFTEILPMLQAIFYPVQGKELTIRQMALLGFRDLVLLKANLEQVLHQRHNDVPPSITQMLLVLQGAHEPKGPTEEYIQLEHLVQLVVSPYLGLYELLPRDRSIANTVCLLDRRFAGPKSKAVDALTDVCEVTASNETMLTPLIEQEGETYLEKCGSLRRHTVANAPTELQLLAMSSMLHPSLREEANSEDKRLLTQPNLNHKHYSSGLNVPEIESEFMNLSPEKTLDMKRTALGSISK